MPSTADLPQEQREAMRFWALDLLGNEPITVIDPENSFLIIGGLTMDIPQKTRRESYETAQQDAAARRRIILEILTERGELTAREVAAELYRRGITPTDERNYSAPRLTELKAAGQIEVTGKKMCDRTGRNVALWAVKKGV